MKQLSLWSLGLLAGLCLALPAQMAADTPEQCEARWSSCLDKAEEDVTACYDRCDARYPDLGPKWDKCYDTCDAASDEALDQCDAQEDACLDGKPLNQTPAPPKPAGGGGATAPSPGMIYGSKQSGQDGCYFGECAGDIPNGGSPQPQQQPQPTQPQPQPQSYPQQQQVPMVKTTAICQTPAFWCQTFDRGVVGSACYCNSPFGPIMGMAVAEK